MKMTPALLVVGALAVFWTAVFISVLLPAGTIDDRPDPTDPNVIWRPMTDLERRGHQLYVENGCSYCHSQYVRPQDWVFGAERIAEPSDYYGVEPAILGTERTGPDLSQAGGQRPDDWHVAHFINPRYTRPHSVMPSWEFLDHRDDGTLDPEMPNITALIAYVQSLGGTDADKRMARQREWGEKARAAYERGPDANVEWLHAQVPAEWRRMPNKYPPTPASLARGRRVYQQHCIGCHGPVGDGQGPAAPYLDPPPLNFTLLRRHLEQDKYIGGILYYQVMNGIAGTAMPYFKKEMGSAKIWDVSNYIAHHFIGYTDAHLATGVPAPYEAHHATTRPDGAAEEVRP